MSVEAVPSPTSALVDALEAEFAQVAVAPLLPDGTRITKGVLEVALFSTVVSGAAIVEAGSAQAADSRAGTVQASTEFPHPSTTLPQRHQATGQAATAEPKPTTKATAIAGPFVEHVQKPGELVSVQAQQDHFTLKQWQTDNPGKNPNLVFAGETYRLPVQLAAVHHTNVRNAVKEHGLSAVVKPGDNLYDIALRHGIDPIPTNLVRIAHQSGIKDPSKIMPGQRIILEPGQNTALVHAKPAPSKHQAAKQPQAEATHHAATVVPLPKKIITPQAVTKPQQIITPNHLITPNHPVPAKPAAPQAPAATQPETQPETLPVVVPHKAVPAPELDIDNAKPEIYGQQWTKDTTVLGHSGFTADQFNQLLEGTHLAGLGQNFYAVEQAYDINGLYLIAHAAEESTWGKSEFAVKRDNLYGYEAYTSDPDAAKTFPTKLAAIQTFADLIKNEYVTPGGKYYSGGSSVSDIFRAYSSSGQKEATTVVNIINENLLDKAAQLGILPGATPRIHTAPKHRAESLALKPDSNGNYNGLLMDPTQAYSAEHATNTIVRGRRYFSQRNVAFANDTYSSHGDTSQTAEEGACEPFSESMILSALTGQEVLPTTLMNYNVAHGLRTYNSGTNHSAVEIDAEQYGAQAQQITTKAQLEAALANNDASGHTQAMVMMVGSDQTSYYAALRPTFFTHSGHYVAADYIGSDGKLYVLDPNNIDNTKRGYDIDTVLSHTNEMWVVTVPTTTAASTPTPAPIAQSSAAPLLGDIRTIDTGN